MTLGRVQLHLGDCLDVMRQMPENSIDAIVSDPPAGINFMNKAFDTDHGGRDNWIAHMTPIFAECLRVTKPGGHALVWALPRTSHWTGMALEDAGWEVRDRLAHLFGSGFPKSLDVSKAIDKAAGADREVVGTRSYCYPDSDRPGHNTPESADDATRQIYQRGIKFQGSQVAITAPATPDAARWEGWGTSLKPACEDWWLCRKPLSEKTVAANVLRWGTGALNVDACRINAHGGRPHRVGHNGKEVGTLYEGGFGGSHANGTTTLGRWPANLVLSHSLWCTDDGCDADCPVALLDAQAAGMRAARPSGTHTRHNTTPTGANGIYGRYEPIITGGYADAGASRFFYTAKASRAERNAGLGGLGPLFGDTGLEERDLFWSSGSANPGAFQSPNTHRAARNHHPTVKPLALMSWLCTLITPPGGVILDPFMGSGSTGCAANRLGFAFLGIEQDAAYLEIARRRIARHGSAQVDVVTCGSTSC